VKTAVVHIRVNKAEYNLSLKVTLIFLQKRKHTEVKGTASGMRRFFFFRFKLSNNLDFKCLLFVPISIVMHRTLFPDSSLHSNMRMEPNVIILSQYSHL